MGADFAVLYIHYASDAVKSCILLESIDLCPLPALDIHPENFSEATRTILAQTSPAHPT